ncbi:MAG: hypothetical protein M3176_03735 [Chloroflexota bacterium]|nr:hypothetical protein [Chloroflexota bacterium]
MVVAFPVHTALQTTVTAQTKRRIARIGVKTVHTAILALALLAPVVATARAGSWFLLY